MKRLVFFLSVCIIIVSGCGGYLHTRRPPDPDADPAAVIRQVERNTGKISTYTGRGTLTISTAEGSQRASVTVHFRRPDSVAFKIEGPLGIDLVSGRMNRDSLTVLSVAENILYTGSSDQLRDILMLPAGLDLKRLTVLFSGLSDPPDLQRQSLASFSVEGRQYKYVLESGETFLIDPHWKAVTAREVTAEDGQPLMTLEADKFESVKGVFVPRLIRLTGYRPRQRLTIFYTLVRPNFRLQDDWYTLSIPKGVHRVAL